MVGRNWLESFVHFSVFNYLFTLFFREWIPSPEFFLESFMHYGVFD